MIFRWHTSRLIVIVAILTCFGGLLPALHAATPAVLIVPRALDGSFIGRSLEYAVDTGKKISVNDAARKDGPLRFRPSTDDIITLQGDTAVWVRFTVNNPAKSDSAWNLECDFPHFESIELYRRGPGGMMLLGRSGIFIPVRDREVMSTSFVFPLTEKPGISEYYMRFEHSAVSKIGLRRWGQQSLITKLSITSALQGLFYGVMFIMFLYNAFIFISVRDISYLYYSLTIIACAALFSAIDATGFGYLWGGTGSTYLNLRIYSLINFFSIIILLAFARVYLQTKTITPFIDKQMLLLSIVAAVLFVVALTPLFSVKLFVDLTMMFFIITIAYSLAVPAIHIAKGSRMAIFYLAAYALLCVGGLVRILAMYAIVPTVFITLYAPQIGCLCMLVLFSLGLADHMHAMKNRLEELNSQLNTEVKKLRYEHSRIQGLDVEKILAHLDRLMAEEKIFCDEDLNLGRLAQLLEIESYQLSQIINEKFHKNFNTFINEYRIREAQEYLTADPDRPISSIAFAIGFNSLSTFNSCFQKILGISPRAYRKIFTKTAAR